MTRLLFLFLLVGAGGIGLDCPTARAEQTLAPPPQAGQAQAETEEQPQEEPPGDEEDALIYRLLSAPEYLWKGFAYPFKRLGIFYERVDLLERAFDFFLNQERTGGVYPRFAVGGAISTGIGFTAFHNNLFNQKKRVRLSYLLGVRENQSAALSYQDPALLDSRFRLETDLKFLSFEEGRFFPQGNQAKEQDLQRFALDQVSWAAKLSHPLAQDLKASFLGRVYVADAGEAETTGPQIPATVPGVNTSIQAFEVEPGVRYDSRDNQFRPTTGWLMDSAFTFTEQVNRDQFRYIGYTIDVQRYIPAFRGNRILVLRAFLAKQDTLSNRSIPFYELNQLDLNHGLRGFERGRWRDEGVLLFNVEWRYPVWERIEGSIFLDEGQVFNDYRDLNVKTFRYSAGGGFRFVTTRQFAFRAQVAVSEDGMLALIRGDLEFLRKRGTLLGGL